MLKSTPTNSFRDLIQGTWGTFNTPAGRVEYIMTKARLGEESLDPERLLTKSLRPVREVMSADDLDFNQLLQRDLDDHRVATNLIRYLLKNRTTGPTFFPPIVAVLLPFRNKVPSTFPEYGDVSKVSDSGMTWRQEQAGESFQVRRLFDEETNSIHSINLAQLRWNSTTAQIVVLDGQHRAMALLAVDRTLSRTWQDNEGAKYRSFYEHQVEQYLKEFDPSKKLDLSKIEVPVTVCWFPELTGDDAHPHRAARQLFVDVNKEARPPSESRIILLSDAELTNVLTRSLLSELRSQGKNVLPLCAVEYDNPDVNSNRPARWSVLTNINLLKMAVTRCVFGPSKYLTNVEQKFGGRESKTERDTFMREQLGIHNIFPSEIQDGNFSYRRDSIGDTNFPLGQVEIISNQFSKTWGSAIISLLSHVHPYYAHTKALIRMENDWSSAIEPSAALARDALFGGVGVYWTLKDSYEHHKDEIRTNKFKTTRNATDDVIKAWELIESKKSDFEVLRAVEYLGSSKNDKKEISKQTFDVFNTHACQLGLIITFGTLWEIRKKNHSRIDTLEIPQFADCVVEALNAYFNTEEHRGTSRDRRVAFSRSVTHPINQISSMDTPRAIYFRYFWLQILDTSSSWDKISDWFPNRSNFQDALDISRTTYFEYCVSERQKSLRASNPGLNDRQRKLRAEKETEKSLRQALARWFDVTSQDFDSWLNKPRVEQNNSEIDSEASISSEDEIADPDQAVSDGKPTSLEELLASEHE